VRGEVSWEITRSAELRGLAAQIVTLVSYTEMFRSRERVVAVNCESNMSPASVFKVTANFPLLRLLRLADISHQSPTFLQGTVPGHFLVITVVSHYIALAETVPQ
jgi:hypothetical protein